MRSIYFLFVFQLLIVSTYAQKSVGYKGRYFIRGNDTLPFRYLEPADIKKGRKYPVIVILHGSGERGIDNRLQLVHGGRLFIDSSLRADYPAYIIFPQCRVSKSWARVKKDRFHLDSLGGLKYLSTLPPTPPLSLVIQLLDSIVNQPSVDRDKIYIGGLSMGGMGVFEVLWRKPGFFAAGFSICGGGDPSKVAIYKDVPLWIFHGQDDPVVPVGNSRRMLSAFKAVGGNVKYSEYKGVVHNSWDNAFSEPGLMPWLFSQTRKKL
jgi:predicted peptidase